MIFLHPVTCFCRIARGGSCVKRKRTSKLKAKVERVFKPQYSTRETILRCTVYVLLAVLFCLVTDFYFNNSNFKELVVDLIPSMRMLREGLLLSVPTFLVGELLLLLRHKLGFNRDGLEDGTTAMTVKESFVAAFSYGFAEEVLFRGVLLEVLGIVGSSALFACAHAYSARSWSYAIEGLFFGMFYAVLYQWSGSLWLCVIVHSCKNLLTFTLAKYLRAGFNS